MRLPVIAAIAVLSGCSKLGHDSNYMPYGLKGMNAYVYDEGGKEYFAGFSDGSYLDRQTVLSVCQANARAFAMNRHWENWDYVCCTITSESRCSTKVK